MNPCTCHFLQVERFWLQGDAAVCVLAGVGLSRTLSELEKRLGRGEMWKTTGWALTIALLAHMVHTNHKQVSYSVPGITDLQILSISEQYEMQNANLSFIFFIGASRLYNIGLVVHFVSSSDVVICGDFFICCLQTKFNFSTSKIVI